MAEWPAEAEILRANLADEIVAQHGPAPVTLDSLAAAAARAVPEAYLKTLRDCMEVRVDPATRAARVWVPPWLFGDGAGPG